MEAEKRDPGNEVESRGDFRVLELITGLFLDRIYFEWDSRGSAITNHKTLIDVTALLDWNCLSFTKEKVY